MMGLSRDALPRDELSGASARAPARAGAAAAGSPPGAHVYVYVRKTYS